MNPSCTSSRIVRWPLVALALALAPSLNAQAPVAEKTITLAFENKPWSEVLDGFAKESGLVMIATEKPTGTVTITSATRQTIAEAIDLLNEALIPRKFILLRINATTFTILSADEKIPDNYVQRIKQDDLSSRAYSEVVEVVIQLKGLKAEEALDPVKQRLGQFGEVKVIDGNRLLIRDTAGNIRTIIKDVNRPCESYGDSLAYTCQSILATDAVLLLTKLLSDRSTTVLPLGSPKSQDDNGRTRLIQITANDRTNTIIITGPPDKLATAEKLLKELDACPPGQKEYQPSEPTLKIYAVPPGTAETLARVLNEYHAGSKFVRIAAIPGKDEVMVLAPACVHVRHFPPSPVVVPMAPCCPPVIVPMAPCFCPQSARVVIVTRTPRPCLLGRFRR
ncbi:secretin N-terminal domain-containing protein [Limnoglobus roseus]|uniref:NolW-like domain-containing protein n=1 Tax=Limnoglobus roseus TaxID=2598579 RepID=A0A5C1ABN0_9BACT|nr:secretin N-terminal domain-containing protein [Limnoglobus roseus]QEL14438.1 hypothetical protein PX52LOC_01326 [Limnoglobus roseus]